ncbi:MAG TPA: TIR domain-containing protein [Desulfobacteria bacterium]|nr:TIR domain-containing protein [Desulfobacteria bacterium]
MGTEADMNYVFICYASGDHTIAKKLEEKINQELSESFHAELVEDRKEGDTTFTEKVIRYFKKCNVFIVLITTEALTNQFVNQEWGYAKCLRELGQIQLLLHVIEKSHDGKRIESKGFISTNMDFIDLERIIQNKPNLNKMTNDVINFLKNKEQELIPILPEVQQKLKRFSIEIKKNIDLKKDLIKNEVSFRERLSMNPSRFQIDYALQVLQVGHPFPISFIENIELYVERIKELNIWKELARDWAICRGKYHKSNTSKFYGLLKDSNQIFEKIRQEVERQYEIYLK